MHAHEIPEIVHVLLLDGVADWEATYAMVGINQPMFQHHPGRYTIRTVGLTGEPVSTMGGATLVPDLELAAVDPTSSAMLIMPGATSWEEGDQPAAEHAAAAFLAAGRPVAAICGATLGLARAGLLNARPHTSNAVEYLAMAPGYSGAAHYRDEPVVADGDLITAGATAPVEFARAIFERLALYTPPVLDAWYALYAKGDQSGFYALMAEASPPEPGAA